MNDTVQPTPNVELLHRTLAHIEERPETWNQATWRCETSMCFAGWTSELAGGRWRGNGPTLIAEPGDDETRVDTLPDGTRITYPWARAQRLLGLDDVQAELLFLGDNSIEDLREMVAKFSGSAS